MSPSLEPLWRKGYSLMFSSVPSLFYSQLRHSRPVPGYFADFFIIECCEVLKIECGQISVYDPVKNCIRSLFRRYGIL